MTTVRRASSPSPGNRWLLPVLLALLIIAIILGVVFGPRIKDALSSKTATPTPTPRVVTATPGPGATPTGTVIGGGPNSSTPLPSATPPPTVVGLSLGMKTYPTNQVQNIQSKANAGDPAYTYHLDPIKTVNKDLPAFGFKAGQFQITQPTAANPTPTPATGADGRPLVTAVVRYNGQYYDVQVVQPGTRGPKGIWLIVSIFQHK